MNKTYIYLILVLTLIGCNKDLSTEQMQLGVDAVRFDIGSPCYEIEQGSPTRAMDEKPVAHLWYTVLNGRGEIIDPPHKILSADLSSLTIEGLPDGNYSILFLATTQDDTSPVTPTLSQAAGQWLSNSETDKPLDLDYLYKKLDFTVGKGSDSRTIAVQLERSVARVQLNLTAANDYSKRFIRKIELTTDNSSKVYKYLCGDGVLGGAMSLNDVDITSERSFYTLPGVAGGMSGTVRVTSVRSDSTTFTTAYKFTGSEFKANKLSTININWSHPEDNSGFLHMRVEDYNVSNLDTMLRDDEPRSVFYNSEKRSFYADQPLQVTLNADKKLQIRFYSAIGIKNVKVLCRFEKYSTEFFDLALMDSVIAFQESLFELPIVSRACTFRSSDGRQVVIPAQPDLSPGDVTLKFVTDDPYMKKIATIKSHWRISFSKYGSDDGHPNWKHMEPMHCREGVVLATNLTFMFSHEDFEAMLLTYDGRLVDNERVPIPLDVIRTKLLKYGGFAMGRVRYVNGMGGGSVFGLTHERYKDHYWDFNNDVHKSTVYHEIGHCIGYGHTSNMTNESVWTMLCSQVMYDMGKAGKLPVNSRKVLNTGDRTLPE